MPEYVDCEVLDRSGSRVTLATPIGRQEVDLGWFASRFTYLGTVGKTNPYMKLAAGMTLGERMTRKQSKCDHAFFVWETPWRFAFWQSNALARFMLCVECGLSVGFRLE